MDELTTQEAARKLGKGIRAIQALIKKKKLPAEKRGRDYFIKMCDLDKVRNIKRGPVPKLRSAGRMKK